jgi:hypothetical protein
MAQVAIEPRGASEDEGPCRDEGLESPPSGHGGCLKRRDYGVVAVSDTPENDE